jgi:hypothetical protein
MAEAYPLDWPDNQKRTTNPVRSQFKTGFEMARKFLSDELARLGATGPVISTNVPLRSDGMPRASMRPDYGDMGVAVYFTYQNSQMVLACDKYDRIYDNIQAVAKTIEAMRGIERWGTSEMMSRAFSGFKALNAENPGESWWSILGISPQASLAEIDVAYKQKLKETHPDRGGSTEKMVKVNLARDQARAARS